MLGLNLMLAEGDVQSSCFPEIGPQLVLDLHELKAPEFLWDFSVWLCLRRLPSTAKDKHRHVEGPVELLVAVFRFIVC
jgi:hypothetical protein